ncbi:hypothetical protein [Deinococcus multiflagellatus]|uniref:Secreted protein n=1 Tax=Deinococcus multiflagellatus TaxID=1656887 RepID=A0ABW1ZI95_9DEIO|nr:hypothetical protein [Deinococcus multiflagellatus]MBZ9713235.1 hypothetical protein [Deinococcus multiflagellatus]
MLISVLLSSTSTAAVQQRPPTSAELAQVLGSVQTFEVTPPKGARSFFMSMGGAHLDLEQRRVLPVTVALLPTGCAPGEQRLAMAAGSDKVSMCVKLTSSYGVITAFPAVPKTLPLNRCIPLYAVQPTIPGTNPGSLVSDPNVAHWTVVSVYFSDQAKTENVKRPDPIKALDFLR